SRSSWMRRLPCRRRRTRRSRQRRSGAVPHRTPRLPTSGRRLASRSPFLGAAVPNDLTAGSRGTRHNRIVAPFLAAAVAALLFLQAVVRLRRRGRVDLAGWDRVALFVAGLGV